MVVETLVDFVREAKRLGATVEETDDAGTSWAPPADRPFSTLVSPYQGGCGSDGCRCSPGLWISGFEGTKHAVAHFGSDYERGGEGFFDEGDHQRWKALRDLVTPRDDRTAG